MARLDRPDFQAGRCQWLRKYLQAIKVADGFQGIAGSRVARDVPVYNAEFAEIPDELAALPIRQIALHRD